MHLNSVRDCGPLINPCNFRSVWTQSVTRLIPVSFRYTASHCLIILLHTVACFLIMLARAPGSFLNVKFAESNTALLTQEVTSPVWRFEMRGCVYFIPSPCPSSGVPNRTDVSQILPTSVLRWKVEKATTELCPLKKELISNTGPVRMKMDPVAETSCSLRNTRRWTNHRNPTIMMVKFYPKSPLVVTWNSWNVLSILNSWRVSNTGYNGWKVSEKNCRMD
jgi:hypothetical protein